MAGMMMVMVMMVRAGEGRHRHHYHGDEQQRQKLFHGRDYSHAFLIARLSKAKRTMLGNSKSGGQKAERLYRRTRIEK